jgi:hypothetical protein
MDQDFESYYSLIEGLLKCPDLLEEYFLEPLPHSFFLPVVVEAAAGFYIVLKVNYLKGNKLLNNYP